MRDHAVMARSFSRRGAILTCLLGWLCSGCALSEAGKPSPSLADNAMWAAYAAQSASSGLKRLPAVEPEYPEKLTQFVEPEEIAPEERPPSADQPPDVTAGPQQMPQDLPTPQGAAAAPPGAPFARRVSLEQLTEEQIVHRYRIGRVLSLFVDLSGDGVADLYGMQRGKSPVVWYDIQEFSGLSPSTVQTAAGAPRLPAEDILQPLEPARFPGRHESW